MFKEYHEMFDNKPVSIVTDLTLQFQKEAPAVYNKDGSVRMFNQGNYKWKFEDTKDRAKIIFEL